MWSRERTREKEKKGWKKKKRVEGNQTEMNEKKGMKEMWVVGDGSGLMKSKGKEEKRTANMNKK